VRKRPTIEFVHTGIGVHPCRMLSQGEATTQYRWGQLVSELSRNEERSNRIYHGLLELVAEGKQVLVISDRLNILDRLSTALLAPPTVNYARITGDTTPSMRAEFLLRFNKKKHQVLLCSNVAEYLAINELEFDYLFLVTPTSHSSFKRRYNLVSQHKTPPIIRDYVDDVAWIRSTIKKRIATAFSKGWGVTITEKPEGEDNMANRHEEKPAYCGRIGARVTLKNGICPECGWHAAEPPRCTECGSQKPPQIYSKRKLATVRTASRIPEKYIVVSGAGQSDFGHGEDPWETTAYDLALLEGGVENCNIVKYTSVIPPEAKEITMEEAKQQRLFQHGMVLECIMAQVNGGEDEHICAGVGTFEVWDRQPVDFGRYENTLIGGFAVEYEGNASPEKAQRLLNESMIGLFERRYGRSYSFDKDNQPVGPHIKNKKFHTKDLVVDEDYGTVLVGLCFVSFQVPTF